MLGLTGCRSDSGFGPDLSAAEADELKTETLATQERVVKVAMDELGGIDRRNGRTVVAVRCSDLADRRYVSLEVRGSFVVENHRVPEVAAAVTRTWRKEGWDVEPFDGFGLVFRTEPLHGIRRNGSASLQDLRDDPSGLATGVGVVVGTGCFAIPDSLVESGWPRGSDP
ncbi:hypothetical protein ASD11_14780 [Aeromicrobium sp. Root495]|uniref:hypothetical protein n=1 Tax=Aeromicrobium sp. Root495 TaxID=1736550 RepID=UPI0006FA0D9C|nr:hypothetical protein [Aeromicrobium sp. Root495]KQY55770.1 hypothetical protein ASD11_14780 [Aeromicrobium sp. Root495]